MAPIDDESIFCPSNLSKIAADMKNTAIARAYAGDFLSMLPERVQSIVTSLHSGDDPAAMDAVLSLKVNARMIGAPTMEQACRTVERHLRASDSPAAALAASSLAALGAALATALTDYLSERSGTNAVTEPQQAPCISETPSPGPLPRCRIIATASQCALLPDRMAPAGAPVHDAR